MAILSSCPLLIFIFGPAFHAYIRTIEGFVRKVTCPFQIGPGC
jgi:hypothetical protein